MQPEELEALVDALVQADANQSEAAMEIQDTAAVWSKKWLRSLALEEAEEMVSILSSNAHRDRTQTRRLRLLEGEIIARTQTDNPSTPRT